MKKLKLIVIGIVLLLSSAIHAQVSVNVNIGKPPAWGPVGYSNVEYYYLPDVQAYYDIRASQFIYYGGRTWIRSKYLPGQYRNYDLYKGYKVVLHDYHGSTPYSNFKNHKVKYYKGYKGKPQKSIGSNRNSNHNNHNQYKNNGNKNVNDNKGQESKGHGNGKH